MSVEQSLSSEPPSRMDNAFDNAKLNKQHFKILSLSAMGVFMDGFDLFIIAVALPLIMHQWGIDAATAGLIGAATPLGAIFGAAIFGKFTDRFGRKSILIISVLFFVIFDSFSALAWGPVSLIAFRFLLGVGIGADYPTGSTYVSETMPASLRGRIMVGNFGFQAIGALCGAILGLVILHFYPATDAWRYMLCAGVVPATFVLFFRFTLPESPRWLMSRGRIEEAKKVAKMITGSDDLSLLGIAKATKTRYRDLFSKKLRRKTILSAAPWFLMDISLYGVGFFTPVILAQMALAGNGDFIMQDILATKSAIYLDVFLVVGIVLAIYFIEKIGRMRLQKYGFIGMFIGLFLLGTSTFLSASSLELFLLFSGFIIFNVMVNAGPNPTTYLLAAEIFPTNIRATGSGFASCTGKVGAAVGIFCLPILKEHIGLGLTMYIIASTALLGFLITHFMGFETKGKSLDSLEDVNVVQEESIVVTKNQLPAFATAVSSFPQENNTSKLPNSLHAVA